MFEGQFKQMRGFISLTEEYLDDRQPETDWDRQDQGQGDLDDPAEGEHELALLAELRDICFKLRAQNPDDGENALGIEMGMQMAADMIDNLIARHTEGS